MAADRVRVLIVDDIAETRENVRKLLQFEPDLEVVGVARSGREGIQLAQELAPDVVLMDINMPDVDGIVATETIRQQTPFVQVVILSVQGETNYMRRAMLAGARDFLTKPPAGDDLISTIRRAGEMAHAERAKNAAAASSLPDGAGPLFFGGRGHARGKIITVYSPKGGTGCTTLAVNLALTLHNDDTRAVLVDANLQFGDAAVFLNMQGRNTIVDLAPRLDELDIETVDEVLLQHEASGLRVLAAPVRPELSEKVSAAQFDKVLEFLRTAYSYVVVDTAQALNDITMSAIDKCDALVVVTTQEIPSIKNVRLFLDLLQTLGIPRDRVVFAMNRYDRRIAITPERVGENLRQPVAAVIPMDERTVIPAVNRGVPFMLDNRSQPAARGIYSLAEAVRGCLNAIEVEAEVVLRR